MTGVAMRLAGPLVAAAIAGGALPAAADAPPDPASMPSWERAFYKTLTFQTLDNLADGALFAVILGAGAGTSVAFMAANAATTALVYYPYEVAWDSFGPPPSTTDPATLATKAVGYQVLTSARKMALSYALTGALLPSAGFAATVFAIDMAVYAANDVAWDVYRPRTEAQAQ